MKKLVISFLMLVAASSALAAGGPTIPLLDFEPELQDKAALQRGAKYYVNYCLGCHSMKYKRYNRLAADLEIPDELVLEHLIFDDSKIGSHMEIPTDTKTLKQWFGAAPPDLTLVARARGDKWLYTYLKSFYVDESRPYGYNNLLFKDVGMPNVLLNVQGDQVCAPAYAVAANGGEKQDVLTGERLEDPSKPCGRLELVEGSGQLSAEEFDQLVSDLVSFMVYAGEPTRLIDREVLGVKLNKMEVVGIYCLLFLCIFFVFAWLLNREYWKDIH